MGSGPHLEENLLLSHVFLYTYSPFWAVLTYSGIMRMCRELVTTFSSSSSSTFPFLFLHPFYTLLTVSLQFWAVLLEFGHLSSAVWNVDFMSILALIKVRNWLKCIFSHSYSCKKPLVVFLRRETLPRGITSLMFGTPCTAVVGLHVKHISIKLY